MKKDFFAFLVIFSFITLFFRQSLTTFFTQDDFILARQFFQNDILIYLANVFGPPRVTHWRPIHNAYFFIAGNLFGKNYWGYHLITLILHALGGFFVFKIFQKNVSDSRLALGTSLIYTIHPAHFVSLFWISGGATVIGFLFLSASFYCYLNNKKSSAVFLFILSLLASEAMLVGLGLFFAYEILMQRKALNKILLINFGTVSLFFLIIKWLLTPKIAFDIYQLEFSPKILASIKYYLARILGFAEVSGDFLISLVLSVWLFVLIVLFPRSLGKKHAVGIYIFSASVITLGLFPFILIPNHLSPHYVNIAIFGMTIAVSTTLSRLRIDSHGRCPWSSLSHCTRFARFIVSLHPRLKSRGLRFLEIKLAYLVIGAFVLIAFYNIQLTINNNWVVKRSKLALDYIQGIEKKNPDNGSMLTFGDNDISSSYEAYIVLGGGAAIKFWFGDKNYQTCFTAFEKCDVLP